jgi:hypothetical protein
MACRVGREKPPRWRRKLQQLDTGAEGMFALSFSRQDLLVLLTSWQLTLLRTLILWALVSSDAIRAVIGQSYKHNRREDDLNSPLSVQPWGADTEKRRYFLIEGSDDTSFRIYRESNPAGFERSWWSVAGTIDELKALAEKIAEGGPKGMKLSRQMLAAVPRFEATEEVGPRHNGARTLRCIGRRPS